MSTRDLHVNRNRKLSTRYLHTRKSFLNANHMCKFYSNHKGPCTFFVFLLQAILTCFIFIYFTSFRFIHFNMRNCLFLVIISNQLFLFIYRNIFDLEVFIEYSMQAFLTLIVYENVINHKCIHHIFK